MNDITLTEDEAKLVAALLKLYMEVFDDARCSLTCECSRCLAMERIGESNSKVFESLAQKVPY